MHYHCENIDNLLHRTFFLIHPVHKKYIHTDASCQELAKLIYNIQIPGLQRVDKLTFETYIYTYMQKRKGKNILRIGA